ncbi:hypothetical protein N7676_16035 [Stenotrophomonas sp. GD03993]|uniref:hypothetical protein n=1 Tax=unclassified Stenotrophomonas TaxID=196198 RepID=UPI002448436E|nr:MULTISPECIES: hypothetical protein [unclassified Stenotrophomonas]MDH0465317.1 hypothetical protein [Stenotrophomonas sp. GD03993]MDH0877838.1 hypothetical protein [Stenotrophomonas sp. GD03877]
MPDWSASVARAAGAGRAATRDAALASASTVRIVLQEIHVAGAAGSCNTWCDRCGLG